MELSDFEVGKSYVVTTKEWEAPDGGVILGKTISVTILPPQEIGEASTFDGEKMELATPFEVESRKEFLRVKCSDGKTHLMHPETIKTAALH